MADPSTVVSALVTHFETEWPLIESTVPWLKDNESELSGSTPNSGKRVDQLDSRADEWVRISVQLAAAEPAALNERITDQNGRFIVMIFVPAGSGGDRAWTMYEKVRNIFQRRRIGGASVRQTEATGFGVGPENLWFSVTASTRFIFESTPT